LILNNSIKKKIRTHAVEEKPKECCGLIISTDDGLSTYKTKNSSLLSNFFKVDPHDYLSATRLGKIVAVYHSHTDDNETFSEFDKFNSVSHGLTYILYSLKNNALTQFSPEYSTFNAYVGRKFEIGKTDCFGLVKDFYEFELNIKMGSFYRDEKFKLHLEEYFNMFLKNFGFYTVEANCLQKYDCIFFGKRPGSSPPHHMGLYLGDDLILHQPEKNYSRIEEYTDRHKKFTNHILRHKEWKTA